MTGAHPFFDTDIDVDSSKRPSWGHFARDAWLFKGFRSITQPQDPAQGFFCFLLGYVEYCNGEKLPGRAMSLTGQSPVNYLELSISELC
jgi:hypothetical protein